MSVQAAAPSPVSMPPGSARQPVRNRVDLHWALRTAQAERGISPTRRSTPPALLASGHASKLLAPVPIRRLGPETLFPLVWPPRQARVIEDDPEASVLPRRDEKRGCLRRKQKAANIRQPQESSGAPRATTTPRMVASRQRGEQLQAQSGATQRNSPEGRPCPAPPTDRNAADLMAAVMKAVATGQITPGEAAEIGK